jgi:mono/diheme cytochrome c family protein
MARKATLFVALLAVAQALMSDAASAFPPTVCDPNQPLSGAKLYADNCASCHGTDATGGRSPNEAPAPDLTVLTRKAKGKFPAPRVADIIRYGGALPDHSISPKMAIWAEVFHAECGPTYSRRAVVELTKFLNGSQK